MWSSGAHGSNLPPWAVDLLIAEAWGVPPWTIEERASAQWVDRWLALKDAQHKAQEKQSARSHNARSGRTVTPL